MDAGLVVRWPFSPFATAIAAGALVAAFCLALWKQHFKLKRRRNSAPASTHKGSKFKDAEDPTEESNSLTKSSSDPSLNIPKENKELGLLSNFLLQSNVASPASTVRLPYVSNLELRPLTLSSDFRNLPRYTKLYSVPDSRKSNHPKFGTIFGINFHELVLRENCSVFGSIYSHLQPLSRRSCPFIGRHYVSRPEYLNVNYKPIYLPFSETSALARPRTNWSYLEGPLTRAVKSVVKEEDFYSLQRENSILRKRITKSTSSDSENVICDDFKVLETETKDSEVEHFVVSEEYEVLNAETEQHAGRPVATEAFVSSYSFNNECLPYLVNTEEQLKIEGKRDTLPASGNDHDIKHTEQKRQEENSNLRQRSTKSIAENVIDDVSKDLEMDTKENIEARFVNIEEYKIVETEAKQRAESPVLIHDIAPKLLETETKESVKLLSINIEEYKVLKTGAEQIVASPITMEDSASSNSFNTECSSFSEEKLTVKEAPSASGNCHNIKHTEQECHGESSNLRKRRTKNITYGTENIINAVSEESEKEKKENLEESFVNIEEYNVLETEIDPVTTEESASNCPFDTDEQLTVEEAPSALDNCHDIKHTELECHGESSNLRKRSTKNITYGTENIINAVSEELKKEKDENFEKRFVNIEEYKVLETKIDPVITEDLASSCPFDTDEQLTVEETPSALDNCHDIKHTEQEFGRENSNLRKISTKSITPDSENNINAVSEELEKEKKENFEERFVNIEEYKVLETKIDPVLTEDLASSCSFDTEDQLTVKDAPSALGDCHDIKHTELESHGENSNLRKRSTKNIPSDSENIINAVSEELEKEKKENLEEGLVNIVEYNVLETENPPVITEDLASSCSFDTEDQLTVKDAPSALGDCHDIKHTELESNEENLRKRSTKNIIHSTENINAVFEELEKEKKGKLEKTFANIEEYNVLEPVKTEDFASSCSFDTEEQLTAAPSALGNCHDTTAECDTLHEVEKSINSTQARNQEPQPPKENLEKVQEDGDKGGGVMTPPKNELSFALETKQTIWIGEANSVERPIHGTIVGGDEGKKEQQQIRSGAFRVTNDRDVRGVAADGGVGEARSRTPDEREALSSQMDCRSGKQSVDDAAGAGRKTNTGAAAARVFESSVTSETRVRPGGVSTVVSSVTVDESDRLWSSQEIDTILDSMSLKTVITTDHTFVDRDEGVYRPTFEEFIPVQSPHGDTTLEDTIKELNEIAGRPLVLEESPPRVSRLLGLLSRDEERRARAQKVVEGASIEDDGSSEWDRILRNVLASVSELERWEENGKEQDRQRRRRDVSPRRDAEDDRQHPRQQSRSSFTMEEEAAPTPKGETPTKVKNLRFKLDPDIFDVPSDDSFYDDECDEKEPRWRKQPKYRAFSTLELNDEPVKLVSVHASVVPAGQKMVARPVGIDLRVRLTEERQSKRAHVGTSPSQAKRRSPVSENRIGWCQELSPVTENVDWRENFQSVSKENNINNNNVPAESKPVPNGILKTPSPKTETVNKDSANPFKEDVKLTNGKLTNGVTTNEKPKPVPNGVHHWNAPPKRLSLPRKKFEPDPEAVERITGYKIALSKPPLPPPVFPKMTSPISKNRAEIARKQYLDSKAALSQQKADGAKKFQQFLTQAQSDRARIVTSVPDLGAIEKAVSEKWAKEKASASQRQSPAREEFAKTAETPSSRGSTPDDAWASYVQSCRKHLSRRSQSLSYLETDIDIPIVEDDDKWRSTSALDEPDSDDQPLPVGDSDFEQSREDLDDSGRAKSEHELRIQRSLQSLPLPDWYKRSDKTKTGFLLKSGEKEKRGWAAAKSLASSTSSLASCGLKRPIHSLRSSRENIPWSRGSSSPDGPTLSLALARAFREPYLGWRARTSTTSSGVSSSPRTSPPSWCAATTDSEVNGVSFDGEDAFGPTSSEDGKHEEPPSLDDTGADAVTVSMDTGELIKLPGGEDTCDDINNMSMETCEMFDTSIVPDVDVDEPSPQADTGDDIDNLSTDTTEDKKKDPKFKRYSYSQSIYHSEWDDEESRGERKVPKEDREPSPSSDSKVIWIESSFVGSRTTTSIMVLPEEKEKLERPASR